MSLTHYSSHTGYSDDITSFLNHYKSFLNGFPASGLASPYPIITMGNSQSIINLGVTLGNVAINPL